MDHYGNRQTRPVSRNEARKYRGVLVRCIAFGLRVQDLCGSCLPGGGVAFRSCFGPCTTFQGHTNHHSTDLLCSLFRYDPSERPGAEGLVTFTLPVDHLFDDGWLADFTAVGQACDPSRELQRGYPDTLAKTSGRQLDGAPFLARSYQSSNLPRQTDPGSNAESEASHVTIVALISQLHGNFGRSNIARVFDHLGNGEPTVGVDVVDDMTGQGELAIFAKDAIPFLDHTFFQCPAHDKDLESGTGFE